MKAIFPLCHPTADVNLSPKVSPNIRLAAAGTDLVYEFITLQTEGAHTALVGVGTEINNTTMISKINSFLPWLQVFPVYPGWHLHLFGPMHSPCLHPGWHIAANRGIFIIFPLQSQLTVKCL